jgi:DHA1 family bicyclomycin/chloramphenicol resistance-like MFS transporter
LSSRPPVTRERRLALILLLGSLTALPALSIDLYLPALPGIADDLGTTLGAVQGTLSVFFAGMAFGQLLYGPLSDRFGRRIPLLVGLAVYVAASVLCAFAPSIEWLWTGRLGQALGGCAAVVISRAAVRDLFDPVESARVFSRLILVMGAAPIFAPLLGGQILRFADWRAIFGCLIAFGIACGIAVYRGLPETHAGTRGAARPAVALRTYGALLADRAFLWPALTTGLAQGSLFAYLVSSPAVLIDQYGVDPQAFGWFFGLNGLGIIGASQVNARLLRRTPLDRLLARGMLGFTLAAAATGVVGLVGLGGPWGISACWFAMLTSLGFVTANATARALASQGARAGSASALIGALQFGTGFVSGSLVAALTAWPRVGTPAHAAALVIAAFALASHGCSRRLRSHG